MAQTSATAYQAASGVVTRVIDGDTLWVKTGSDGALLKVRIHGVDAPEICQPGGAQARDALKRQVFGQRITLNIRSRDDYGRAVASVYLQDIDMARWLVVNGHAWAYNYRDKKAKYADELAQAQAERRGLFNYSAQEPRQFRKRHGRCY